MPKFVLKNQQKSKKSVIASLPGEKFTLTIIDATIELPTKMILLRDDVFVSELALLNPSELLTSEDRIGIHVLLQENSSNQLIGATHVAPAEKIHFMQFAGFKPEELSISILSRYSVVAKNLRAKGIISLMNCAAANYYKHQGRKKLLTFLPKDMLNLRENISLQQVANGIIRNEYLQSGHSVPLAPFFIPFQHLLYPDIEKTKDLNDLIQEINSFDWSNSTHQLNLQNQVAEST